MNWLSLFLTANLIGIGSNLDNCGVGIAYGAERIKLPHWVNAVINAVGFCTALLGTCAGHLISYRIPAIEAKWVACILLSAIGVFSLYAAYVHPRIQWKRERRVMLQKPGLKQGILLGFGLSLTNIASSFSATVADASTVWMTVVSITVWGYVLIWIGNISAIGLAARFLGKFSSLFAGLLLVGIGIHQII